MFYQQGDVLLKAIPSLPKQPKPVNGLVLARGEATGHAHIAEGQGTRLWSLDDVLYLDAPEGAVVTHNEHAQIAVAPGIYEIGHVQEYDHFAEEARRVQD